MTRGVQRHTCEQLGVGWSGGFEGPAVVDAWSSRFLPDRLDVCVHRGAQRRLHVQKHHDKGQSKACWEQGEAVDNC